MAQNQNPRTATYAASPSEIQKSNPNGATVTPLHAFAYLFLSSFFIITTPRHQLQYHLCHLVPSDITYSSTLLNIASNPQHCHQPSTSMATEGDILPTDAPIITDTTEEAGVIPKLKGKQFVSQIWDHFTKVFINPGDKRYDHSLCNYCKVIKYANTTATTTLWSHLNKCRSYPYNKFLKKQKTIESFQQLSGNSMISWKFDQTKSRKALAKMIIMDELPFSFIEGEGFRQFCNECVPRLQLVSRVTIAKDCMGIYADLKRDLKSVFCFNAQRVCLTTDTWTSLQNLSYMVITAHFIDHNWKLHKRILNFFPISSHKGVAIGNAIEACMIEWGIKKIFTMTVDNASSNDIAIAHLKKKISNKNALVMDGDYFHIRCCAHIINLKEEGGSIEKIRAVVRYIRASPQRAHQFRICCEKDENSYKNNLVLDVPTRWNYTYLMLETALKFQKSIERYEESDPFYAVEVGMNSPTVDDWKNAQVFCKFLKTFYEVTKKLSGSLYVTSNSYFHDIMTIQSTIYSWSNSRDPILRNMANRMSLKFDKYWGSIDKINMLLLIAVVMDPRFKLKYVSYCYKKVYPQSKVDELELKLRMTLNRLYNFYEQEEYDGSKKRVENSVEMEFDGVEVLDDEVINFTNDFESEQSQQLNSESELDIYLEEKLVKSAVGECFDILNWWKVNSSRFRIISVMARDVLAVPVSTVASESAFSTGGRVLSQYRSSLCPSTVEALICAQDWLRASPVPIDIDATMDEVAELETAIKSDSQLWSAFFGATSHS